MKLLFSLILAVCVIGLNANLDLCYGDLGCFNIRPTFSINLARPLVLLPQSPETVQTTFYLYTRSIPAQYSNISLGVENAKFDPQRETKFIIHGFLGNGFNNWVLEIKDALLRVGDYNVIVVDWSKGNGFPYTQATANTQVVGDEISKLIKGFAARYGTSAERFHIIGHSLGAHIAGYAGERTPGLGRITGLDPAGPYFENTDTAVRLDESDANYVDVIHTDAASTLNLGFGLMQRSGHVDYYPNGGKDQPNCPGPSAKLLTAVFNGGTINIDAIEENIGCSHMSAVYMFRDTIENDECRYVSYPCNSFDDFKSGSCLQCNVSGCNRMGFWSNATRDSGMLYLTTQDADSSPYCQHHYSVKLNSNSLSSQTQARGKFTFVLNGERLSSLPLLLDDSDVTFKSGSSYLKLTPSTRYLGEDITSATVQYTKTTTLLSSWLYQDQWSFKDIEVVYGDNQKYVRLCPEATYVVSGSSLTFRKC